MHSDVGQREDDDIVGFPGKQMANDASLVAGIGDFRNDLPLVLKIKRNELLWIARHLGPDAARGVGLKELGDNVQPL